MESRKVAKKIAKNPKNLPRKFLDILSLNVIKLKALISVLHNRAIYKRKNKTRLKLDHLYEHVLSKTKTARINGSRLISVLDSFSCE